MIKNRPGGSVQDAPWMRYGGERCLGGAANLPRMGPVEPFIRFTGERSPGGGR